MKQATVLRIEQRGVQTKGEIKNMRKAGIVPASISRKGSEAISFSIKKDDLAKALAAEGMNSVFQLNMEGSKPLTAMVREIQHAPLTRDWLHVTFQYVSLTEETHADIPINIIGRDDVTYKGLEALQQLDMLNVRGLPTDFPNTIDITVSEMGAGDHLYVRDVELPEGLVCTTDPDRIIFSVSYPRAQEVVEETPAEDGVDAADAAAEGEAETEAD